MVPETGKPLEVAIVGGGIIGLALAIGLMRRDISFTVYERATALRELGAAIGLTANAAQAMELLDPRIHQAWRAVAVPVPVPDDYNKSFRFIDGYNEPEGDPRDLPVSLLFKIGETDFVSGLRYEFLAAMERLIPGHRIKLGKNLVSVVTQPPGASKRPVLEFQDGSTAEADVVVGCDGIRSQVRHVMFGPGPRAQYTHRYAFRALVPMASARPSLGETKTSGRFMYCGPDCSMITFPVGRDSLLNVVSVVYDAGEWPIETNATESNGAETNGACRAEASDTQPYVRPATRSEALHAFRNFGPSARTVISLLPEKLEKWAIFDMLDSPAPSFARGPLCLAGDAAHASSPHHGAGAGMGMEDALVLAELLAHLTRRQGPSWSSAMITEALDVYSAARYERAMWVVASSRVVGGLIQWQNPECGRDKDKMEAEYVSRLRRICDFDVEAMVRDALATLHQRLTTPTEAAAAISTQRGDNSVDKMTSANHYLVNDAS